MNDAERSRALGSKTLTRDSGLGLPLFLFITFHLFAAVLLQYGGIFGPSSDFDYYVQLGRLTDLGAWPYLTYWSEYPPIFPWLAVGVYRFAELIAAALPPVTLVVLLLRMATLPFEIGNLLLVGAITRRLFGPEAALRSVWVYTALFAPTLIWLGWFDPVPVCFALLSVLMLLDRRPGWAGVACGLGIATKIIPGVVALVALRQGLARWNARKQVRPLIRFAVASASTVGLICLPFAFVNFPVFAVSARSWFVRPPWETFWAVLEGYYSFGFVPTLLSRATWSTYNPILASHPWLSLASLGCLALTLVVLLARNWFRFGPTGLVTLTAALYAGIILMTSGFSPQFIDWLFPFAVILLPGFTGAVYVTGLTVAVLLGERYLYYSLFPPDAGLLAGLVALRSALLVGLIVEFWRVADPRWRLIRPRWRRVYAGSVIVGALVFAAFALRAYAAGGWGTAVLHDPPREVASEIQAQTDQSDALLTFDPEQYEQLGPWLANRAIYFISSTDVTDPAKREATLRAAANQRVTIIVLDPGKISTTEEQALDWLTRYGTSVGDQRLESGIYLRRYTVPPGLTWPAQPPAVDQFADFGGQVDLLGFTSPGVGNLDRANSSLRLTFYWRPLTRLAAAMEPVIEVRDQKGHLLALRRAPTASPYLPSHWNPGQVVLDDEDFTVASGRLAGPVHVTVGWINRDTGTLLATDSDAGAGRTYVTLRKSNVAS